MKRAVVIVAGGSGSRMNSGQPKQFIEIAGKPVLLWTVMKFLHFDPEICVVLVLPEDYIPEWKKIMASYVSTEQIRITKGGETRFHSVKNGLELTGDCSLTAIHDAARPLVSEETIGRCYDRAGKHGGVIPVTGLHDSLRMIRGDHSAPVDRQQIVRVQTPQVFLTERIRKAYEQEYRETFTDDASVYETLFGEVALTEGNRENIKITYPEDLIFAKELLQREQ